MPTVDGQNHSDWRGKIMGGGRRSREKTMVSADYGPGTSLKTGSNQTKNKKRCNGDKNYPPSVPAPQILTLTYTLHYEEE